MAVKKLYSVGDATVMGRLVRTTDEYKYEDTSFQYLGVSQLFDAGDKAKREGAKSFESIKTFIESKGKEQLISQ